MLVYLAVGSNQGDSLCILRAALIEVERLIGSVVKRSQIYSTKPWGNSNQGDFLNQILVVRVDLDKSCKLDLQNFCNNILQIINKIEVNFGRVRDQKWGPRTLDIDILFVNGYILNTNKLTIPHKEIANRKFVLVPLSEIAHNFMHPILGKTIETLLKECTDDLDVQILN